MIKIKFINFEKHKDLFGIYKITNILNNKVYIGQTRQPFKKRFWHHSWKLKNNTHDGITEFRLCHSFVKNSSNIGKSVI